MSTGDRNETCRVWSIQRRRLETLVGKLVPAFLGGDSAYLPTFLGTYRAFGTPSRCWTFSSRGEHFPSPTGYSGRPGHRPAVSRGNVSPPL